MTDPKNTVSDELLAEMLAGLEGVTPGPWYHVKGRGPHHLGWEVGAPNDGISVSKKAEVSAHIARCSPDTMRSILTELQSLRASIPGGVGVKGLEWVTNSPIRKNGDLKCDAVVGRYEIGLVGGRVMVILRLVKRGDAEDIDVGSFDTFEEAKAAAQADYERRILSALGQLHKEGEQG